MNTQDAIRFSSVLAKYLVEDQARMSIKLGMGSPEAQAWAEIRNATPLFGYPTVEEAEKTLLAWLVR